MNISAPFRINRLPQRRASAFALVALAAIGVSVSSSAVRAAGILVPTRDDVPPLRIDDHLVTVDISNQIALTTLNQTFENTSDQRLEATYIFPIPEGADITDFRMTFNGKMVEGEVLPADEAREIYESIVRRQRDPGLIEFIGRRLLRARVFPIEPHSKTEILISYQQVIDNVSGMSRYRYPLRTPGTSGRAYGTVRFSVNLDSRAPLKTVWSPTHTVEVVRDGEHRAKVAFEKSGASLNDDFILFYDTDEKDVGMSLVAFKPEEDEPGHFVLILTPRDLWEDDHEVPQDYVFVVDTSGSMAGEKIEQARSSLKYCIDRLDEADRFSIVRFSTGFDVIFDELQDADQRAKANAKDAVDRFEASGGTNIFSALEQAAKLHPEDSDRPFVIIFMTDGLGDRSREEIEKMLTSVTESYAKHLRLFPFGVGHDVNTKLLDGLATNYGGTPTYVQPGENLEHVLGDFFAVFSEPVLTDLRLSLPNAGIRDKFPPEPGDLYHGRQLILAGAFDATVEGSITLKAKRGDEEVEFTWDDVEFESADGAWYVSRIWAGRKIAYLLDRIRLVGESDEMVDEVVALATEYGIQTPYTSWLVAPESERTGVRLGVPASRGGGGGFGFGEGAPAPSRPTLDRMREMSGGRGAPAEAGESIDLWWQDADRADAVRDESIEAYSIDALVVESGKDAVRYARRLGKMRDSETAEPGGSERLLLVRKFNGVEYWNLRGALVDKRFAEDTEAIMIKFGSDAYFDFVLARPEYQKVLAAGKFVIMMATDDLAVVIHPNDGLENLSDEDRDRIAKK